MNGWRKKPTTDDGNKLPCKPAFRSNKQRHKQRQYRKQVGKFVPAAAEKEEPHGANVCELEIGSGGNHVCNTYLVPFISEGAATAGQPGPPN